MNFNVKSGKKVVTLLLAAALVGNEQSFAGVKIALSTAVALAPVAGLIASAVKVHEARTALSFEGDKDENGQSLPNGEKRVVTDPEECRRIRESRLVKWGILLGFSCLGTVTVTPGLLIAAGIGAFVNAVNAGKVQVY